jgi:predicted ester cyclase
VPPNGKRVVFDLINIFRFDDRGRLIEEWVRTDNRGLLRQLGVEGSR